MRSRLANDMMGAVNLTHRVERAMLEQKLEDAEQNVAIRDLKLQWVSSRDSHADSGQLADLGMSSLN